MLLLLFLWLAAGLPYGAHRVRVSERAWAERFLTEEQFQARSPAREHSKAALSLDALARKLGTFVAYLPDDRPLSADSPQLKEARTFLGTVRKETRAARPRVPPGVSRLVETHAAELAAIERILLAEPVVQWKTASGEESTVSLLGLRNVHALLLVRSLIADQRGDLDARNRAIDAGWRLAESMSERPTILDVLIRLALVSEQNACIRQFGNPPPAWLARVLGDKPFALMSASLQGEARAYCRSAQRLMGIGDLDSLTGDALPEVGLGRRFFRVTSAPFLRFNVAGYSDALRVETEKLQKSDPCGFSAEIHEAAMKKAQPAWNILSKVALARLGTTWMTARNALLDDELTARVLEGRALQSLTPGSVERRPSLVCPTVTWVRTAAENRQIAVRAEGGPVGALEEGGLTVSFAFGAR